MTAPEPPKGASRRVLLLERDEGLGRSALARDATIELLAVTSCTNALVEMARFRPTIVVASFLDPLLGDVGDVRRIREASEVPILVMSKSVGESRVIEFIKAGARGYLFSEDAPRLPEAVRDLLRGGLPMSAPISGLVLARARRSSAKMAAVAPASARSPLLLTPRQLDILKLLASGHSYDDIGLALQLSVNTVRTHVRAIYERLGASTKVEAVVAAMELKLID